LALKQQLDSSNPERTYHTTYLSYQKLNRKNGFYTLQDNMARMLQCIRGLSEEKIAALIERYPTPRSLYEAFLAVEENQTSLEVPVLSKASGRGKGKAKIGPLSPELALTELGDEGRRKIGPALSKHIYDVFMNHSYDSE
jgi:crossover junction endonuclease MUS81